ncbi:hypothetical protein QLH51_06475 [Sphingomonas sp. 2R-10]|uniref:hypothetical protein n=1 Tax=Sphingomonas sp. 2R-10 TaxID=3045148 RepID=UPI000F79E19A|nr:hypothetical protein [Sphingomonas sp. 2R-10]MDJ0276442.1 hypothetical protein [Sphingomonas sp. 2R-10]
MKALFVLVPALALAGMAAPATAAPQQRGTQAQRADNARQSAALRARIGQVEARIAQAEQTRAIDRTQATLLRRDVARTRQDLTRLSRRQGFVSPAELASFNRTLGGIDVVLDNRGVARSLAGDVPNHHGHGHAGGRDPRQDFTDRGFPTAERHYGNDALPSAEVTAFQRTDARLRYRNARIERDGNGCAVYEGTARDGKVRRERLLSPSGQPICTRR